MLAGLRSRVKGVPILGPGLLHLYLVAFYSEGKDETIRDGPLRGMKFRRFMHTYCPDYVNGDYEPEIQAVFIELIRPGQVVYDVGANVGFMTLLASKLVGPPGLVVAFEPGHKTAAQLRAQVRINRLGNVVVEECAMSDRVGTGEFTVEDISVMARLAGVEGAADGKKPKTRSVRTTMLDHEIGHHRPPDVIKMDIEGAELLALGGASRLLESIRPILIVELHSAELSRGFHALMDRVHYGVRQPSGEEAEPGDFRRFIVARPLPA